MPSLHAAVALEEVHRVAILVCEHLQLDVARLDQEPDKASVKKVELSAHSDKGGGQHTAASVGCGILFNENSVVTERGQCLPSARIEHGLQVLRLLHHAHALLQKRA